MKNERVIVKKLREGLYLFDEAHESTGYLLIGNERACLIDTMIGYQDLYELVRRYTQKPIVVINTHGHPDHIYGNVYFDKAYMNCKDLGVANEATSHPEFIAECKKRGLSMPPFEDIHEGDVIDLGGKTLKVYEMPGHTPGGILLLCKEERILFTGDSINHHLWMQLPECSSIKALIESLERIAFLETEADFILHGHARDFDNITLMRALYDGAKSLLEGNTENDADYKWFGGLSKQHAFTIPEDDPKNPGQHVICYDPGNIRS